MEPLKRNESEMIEHLARLDSGRDEMNLIELPFATLGTRVPKDVNVLEYEIEEFDRNISRPVRRKLTVVGDAKHGLPTAPDEEVYLGLLHVTKAYNDFTSPKVLFSRGQLIDVLGWPRKDSSYARLTLAMDRLRGVSLICENSWRDNATKEWRSRENIGIIDSYVFRDSRRRGGDASFEERYSEFRWGSKIFESFDAGYLKRLDLRVVRQLSPLGRRLYRYLDKHFHPPHRTRLEFDIRTLLCERFGASRACDVTHLRDRLLKKACEELEVIGFIEQAKTHERFTRVGTGRWNVVFEMKEKHAAKPAPRVFQQPSRPGTGDSRVIRPEHRIFRASDCVPDILPVIRRKTES
jgi:hypothetical protein